MDLQAADSTVLSNLLKEYITTPTPSKRKEYALRIKNLCGYEGFSELFAMEESSQLDKIELSCDTDAIDAKVSRLLPGMRRDEFPVFVLGEQPLKKSDSIDTRCEEVLKSRKTECYGQTYDFDLNAFLSIPDDIPPYYWYFCIFKEVLRDCQFLLEMVLSDGCKEHCSMMNATDGFEYLCSCHPKAMKCSAAEYYYHNLNFCTLHLFSIQTILQDASNRAQDIQKEMYVSLRRLYRLYLHAFYQHYSVFAEEERKRHMYAKFFGFVTYSGLLLEKDMKPYLSLDDMNDYVYCCFSLCCLTVPYMEDHLSREEKRKRQKKERKKRQRQEMARIRIEQPETVFASPESTCRNEEREEGRETDEMDSTQAPCLMASVCEQCHEAKTRYYCEDCHRCYCEKCYDEEHRKLQAGNVFHVNAMDLKTEPSFPIQEEHDGFQEVSNTLPTQLGKGGKPSHAVALPEKKQHKGLRCKKCFELLVRDDEFLYVGGKLYTNPSILKKRGWDALHDSNGIVFCKNKHNVGRVARATYANQGIPFYRLTPEKTTWKENYVDNPAFAHSSVIEEKAMGTSRPLMPCEQSVL